MDIHKSNINNISEYLNDPHTSLGIVIHKAKALQDLYHILAEELAPEFREHFWIGTYEKGILSILVDSAILATKLRFLAPSIRDKLRKDVSWFELSSILIKIMVTMPSINPISIESSSIKSSSIESSFAAVRAPTREIGEIGTGIQNGNGMTKKITLSMATRTQLENIADDLDKIPGSQDIANALRGIVTVSQAD